MGYVNNTKDPELVFKIDSESEKQEIENIRRMVENMNNQLNDSGYEAYQYNLELVGNKAYIRKI
jgi:predicted Co/Zn/Cd cation transporter (cation efflux family)|tara:strand:- start:48 stop:239 length:192 start_codon:yes stop_codon:yes gene_type:complete